MGRFTPMTPVEQTRTRRTGTQGLPRRVGTPHASFVRPEGRSRRWRIPRLRRSPARCRPKGARPKPARRCLARLVAEQARGKRPVGHDKGQIRSWPCFLIPPASLPPHGTPCAASPTAHLDPPFWKCPRPGPASFGPDRHECDRANAFGEREEANEALRVPVVACLMPLVGCGEIPSIKDCAANGGLPR